VACLVRGVAGGARFLDTDGLSIPSCLIRRALGVFGGLCTGDQLAKVGRLLFRFSVPFGAGQRKLPSDDFTIVSSCDPCFDCLVDPVQLFLLRLVEFDGGLIPLLCRRSTPGGQSEHRDCGQLPQSHGLALLSDRSRQLPSPYRSSARVSRFLEAGRRREPEDGSPNFTRDKAARGDGRRNHLPGPATAPKPCGSATASARDAPCVRCDRRGQVAEREKVHPPRRRPCRHQPLIPHAVAGSAGRGGKNSAPSMGSNCFAANVSNW